VINPTTLLLVRHVETEANAQMWLAGWTESELSPHGEAQLQVLADHFKRVHADIDAVYASPLLRARLTAEAIGRLTGHSPILFDDLREMYFGELDGRPFEELKDAYAHILEADQNADLDDFVWPNGESRSGFSSRVLRVMNLIASHHVGRSVAVVTHGGVIATLLTFLHGESAANWRKWVVPNASLTEIQWDAASQQGAMLRHGDDTHLAELAAAWESP
jgi:broad specificity phosphatase PhoE